MLGEAVKGEPRQNLQQMLLRSEVERQILDTSEFKVTSYSQHLVFLPLIIFYLCF